MRPYLIVGTFRTGSSALAEQLALHPNITCGWESTEHALGKYRIELAEQFLRGKFDALLPKERMFLKQRHGPRTEAIGFRLLFRSTAKWFIHPSLCPVHVLQAFNPHLFWLNTRRDIAIIHIVRRNNVEWLKSLACARASDCYFGEKYPTGLSVTWNIREALKRVKMKQYLGQKFGEFEASHRYCRVEYESFRADNSATLKRVLEFLNCDPALPLESEPKAVIQSSESNMIRNADELAQALERHSLRFE